MVVCKRSDDSFLSNFAKKPFTVNEQIKLIHDFLNVRRGVVKILLVHSSRDERGIADPSSSRAK